MADQPKKRDSEEADEKDEAELDERDESDDGDESEERDSEGKDDDESADEEPGDDDEEPRAKGDDADDEEPGDEDESEDEGDEDEEAAAKAPPSKAKAAASARDEDDEDDEDAGDAASDEAADRVAAALGVGDDEGGADKEGATAASQEEEEGPKNRAARRRDEARDRRRKRKGGAEVSSKAARAKPDEELPKDKNARAKELLLRRREEGRRGADVGSALLPGEMVDDALSRMASGTSRWIKKNFNVIQWVLLATVVGVGGFLFYSSRVETKVAGASGVLASAVAAERGKVMAEDKRSDDEKEYDTAKVFKTAEERAEAALASYNQVVDTQPGTGAAILAKLGQAGIYLEKKEWPAALEAYSAVASSSLAAADPDVKGRATEGIGFAKEGKGDLDGALASFKELESIDAKGYKELSLYHQARMHVAKGDKEKAKELLKSAREKLAAPSTEGKQFQFLEAVVDESLRRLDPSAVPARTQLGGPKGSQMTPEELERLIKKAREAAEKKKEQGDDH